jgi:hypothetical protein
MKQISEYIFALVFFFGLIIVCQYFWVLAIVYVIFMAIAGLLMGLFKRRDDGDGD